MYHVKKRMLQTYMVQSEFYLMQYIMHSRMQYEELILEVLPMICELI